MTVALKNAVSAAILTIMILPVLSSCTKQQGGGKERVSFTASGLEFKDGDRIRILWGDGTESVSAEAKDGRFITDFQVPTDAGTCVAIYPEGRSCTFSGAVSLENLNINYVQNTLPATLKNAKIYAAEGSMSGGELKFTCQSGILEFHLNSSKSYYAEYRCGDFLTGGMAKGGGTFYLPVKPGTYEDAGMRVKLSSGEDYPSMDIPSKQTISAAQTVNLGTVEDAVFSEGTLGSKNLRAMSFNILRGDLEGPDHIWSKRKDACLEMLSTHKPDILGTVECTSVQKNDILDSTPEYGAVGLAVNGSFYTYSTVSSNSIYYNSEKLLLKEWGTIWLSDTPDTVSNTFYYNKPRTAVWARFKLKQIDANMVYICVHLQDNSSGAIYPYSEDKAKYGSLNRQQSVALIVSRLPQINPDGWPVLLGGDFNAAYDSKDLKELYTAFSLVASNSTTSDTGNTFNGFKSPQGSSRIDHLFSSKCTHSLFAVDRSAYASVTYISDHFPIYTDFTIE